MARPSRPALSAPPHERTVALTFDDAFLSVYDIAFPILSRLGFRATLFVPTRRIGGDGPWRGRAWIAGSATRGAGADGDVMGADRRARRSRMGDRRSHPPPSAPTRAGRRDPYNGAAEARARTASSASGSHVPPSLTRMEISTSGWSRRRAWPATGTRARSTDSSPPGRSGGPGRRVPPRRPRAVPAEGLADGSPPPRLAGMAAAQWRPWPAQRLASPALRPRRRPNPLVRPRRGASCTIYDCRG